jgi:hypothetical protein
LYIINDSFHVSHGDFMSPASTQQQPPHAHFQLPPNEHKQCSTRPTATDESMIAGIDGEGREKTMQGLETNPRCVFFLFSFIFYYLLLVSTGHLHDNHPRHDRPRRPHAHRLPRHHHQFTMAGNTTTPRTNAMQKKAQTTSFGPLVWKEAQNMPTVEPEMRLGP